MRIDQFAFGSIRIDGVTYEHDVVIDGGKVRKRKKKPSKLFRDQFGHTPLSVAEDIPWACQRLVIGTGAAWCAAGDGRGQTGGCSPQHRDTCAAHYTGNR
jgi:hypothetical protein